MIELTRETAADTYLGPYCTPAEADQLWDAIRSQVCQPFAVRLVFDDVPARDRVARAAWCEVFPEYDFPFDEG